MYKARNDCLKSTDIILVWGSLFLFWGVPIGSILTLGKKCPNQSQMFPGLKLICHFNAKIKTIANDRQEKWKRNRGTYSPIPIFSM